MKLLLNGATADTNFGDFLFAKMFQEQLSQNVGEDNVFWYSSRFAMSNFFADHLDNHNKCKLKDIDALIYISGGYFCGNDHTWRDYVLRYLRYFSIGMKCIIKRIPYAIIGLEVGKSHNALMRFVQKKILKKAKIIVVRNKESFQCVKSYGIDNVICTADTAFAINRDLFSNKPISSEIADCNKKILLFHIFNTVGRNKQVTEKVVPILNRFLEVHQEYAVVLTTDQYISGQELALDDMAKRLKCKTIIKNFYEDPIALCKVIDRADVVVTPKLHVGIIGARLGKSVVSFCEHSEKVLRLYSQLDESGRSAPLADLDEEKGLEMLEKYHTIPINVPNDIAEKAKTNFEHLNAFLECIERKRD